jgi:hypothetical protein
MFFPPLADAESAANPTLPQIISWISGLGGFSVLALVSYLGYRRKIISIEELNAAEARHRDGLGLLKEQCEQDVKELKEAFQAHAAELREAQELGWKRADRWEALALEAMNSAGRGVRVAEKAAEIAGEAVKKK